MADLIKDGANADTAAHETDAPPEGDDPDYRPSRRGR